MNKAVNARSATLLTTFLEADTLQTPSGGGVRIRLRNVRFRWSEKVYVDNADLTVRAVPVQGSAVDFDDPGSFVLGIQHAVVGIRPDVLEGMFNESVFNYPESKLRDLKVELLHEGSAENLRVKGRVNVVLWMPFTMDTHLTVNTASNALAIHVDKLKLLGFLPATKLIQFGPFHLDKIIPLPPNQSLIVAGNQILVKPFGLFPPPRIRGKMSGVRVTGTEIRLAFAGDAVPGPESSARNYVYLQGGSARFGRFGMVDTDIVIEDGDPRDPFVFSLLHYADMIPRSRIEIHDTKSVRVTMPDYGTP